MITIKIKTGNSAFEGAIGLEVARILREMAYDVENTDEMKATYNDANGNKVAKVTQK